MGEADAEALLECANEEDTNRLGKLTTMSLERKITKYYSTQRNKETDWNTQPIRSPLLFQNKGQKPVQKALKR